MPRIGFVLDAILVPPDHAIQDRHFLIVFVFRSEHRSDLNHLILLQVLNDLVDSTGIAFKHEAIAMDHDIETPSDSWQKKHGDALP